MSKNLLLRNWITNVLVGEAQKTLGIHETGFNSGRAVEEFQKTVDGKATREPWCMAWLQTIAARASSTFHTGNPLFPSENCLMVYRNVPQKYRSAHALPGFAVIFAHQGGKGTGHCGLVTEAEDPHGDFKTIEGNTSARGSREGTEVAAKERYNGMNGPLQCIGFIDLPGMVLDLLQHVV